MSSLTKLGINIKEINPPSVHVLGDFNFGDIVWPDRHNKCGSPLSRIEGQILVDIINDHGFDQLVHSPTRERNTLDLIITSLPNQFVDIHSPDCLSDQSIVSGTLKIVIPHVKKPRRKVYRYQKGDYKSMRADTLKAKENISMATRIPVRFRKISNLLNLSFRTRQISISHQKQVALSLPSHGCFK